jgi:lipopolysaccharide transport system ATP-binding protein
MRATVIQAQGLSKRYRLGVTGRQTVASEFNAFVARNRGKADPRNAGAEGGDQRKGDQFWALRNVSFDVAQGEVLGLIGRNGAGKSTVLKLLSRITLPTSGSIHMKGRVSSLLEVGTGFHPELTGMENIYLNGAIMGMRRAEIDAKLDEIIAFSGIEHHIDTPIKRYSSGMKVRLGFAVAAHLEPDILVVDEVLAVGDAEFQKRCLGQMRSVADSGRTIIFVSHNMFSVQSLCTRAIWLDKGTVRTDGEVVSVVRDYSGRMRCADRPPTVDRSRCSRNRRGAPDGPACHQCRRRGELHHGGKPSPLNSTCGTSPSRTPISTSNCMCIRIRMH